MLSSRECDSERDVNGVPMRFTVSVQRAWWGRNCAAHLEKTGHEVYAPRRDEQGAYNRDLGHVIYCIGVTADFRRKPFETVAAHVTFLAELLQRATFDSFLYLSSTRVYLGAGSTEEGAACSVNVNAGDDFYNLTKLTGEALCFASGRKIVRVARLSNVFNAEPRSENFLSEIVRDALNKKEVVLRTSLDSQKDYISIRDTVELLARIAVDGKHTLYNVASGKNLSNRELLHEISSLTGCSVVVVPNAPVIDFPRISIARLEAEFSCPHRICWASCLGWFKFDERWHRDQNRLGFWLRRRANHNLLPKLSDW